MYQFSQWLPIRKSTWQSKSVTKPWRLCKPSSSCNMTTQARCLHSNWEPRSSLWFFSQSPNRPQIYIPMPFSPKTSTPCHSSQTCYRSRLTRRLTQTFLALSLSTVGSPSQMAWATHRKTSTKWVTQMKRILRQGSCSKISNPVSILSKHRYSLCKKVPYMALAHYPSKTKRSTTPATSFSTV